MIVKSWHLSALLALLLLWQGCQTDEQAFVPDVSDIAVEVDIRRFEQDFFQVDTSQMEAEVERLRQAYPEFSAIFFDQLLGVTLPHVAPEGPAAYLKGFLQHPPLVELYDSVQVHYQDMSGIEGELKQAFQFFRYYFPEEPLPTFTTLVSEYVVAAFVYGENDLAVSLDYFLGRSFPYQRLNPNDPAFSAYLVRTFTQEHLVSKAMQAMISGLVAPPRQQRMLDIMIQNGKQLYVLDKLLPYTADSIKLEVTAQQAEWLNSNEREMWAYFIQEELIYSTERERFRKLVDYSPNSPGMPEEAPGRTANWLGWQIVKAYMKTHPEATLSELLNLEDAQAILDESRYKPKR